MLQTTLISHYMWRTTNIFKYKSALWSCTRKVVHFCFPENSINLNISLGCPVVLINKLKRFSFIISIAGYNTNQVDYVLGHKDKYNEGPHYQPPIINSSATAANNSSSSTHHYNSSSQAIPLGGPNQGHSSSSYTTETRVTGGGTGAPVSNNYSNQNYSSSAYNSQSSQHQTKSIPVQNYQVRSRKKC